MDVARSRLARLASEIAELPTPTGSRSEAPKFVGCLQDSGTVFQPEESRSWHAETIGTGTLTTSLRDILAAQGWRDEPNPAPGAGFLVKQYDAWTASATVTAMDRDVVLEVRVRGLSPCRAA